MEKGQTTWLGCHHPSNVNAKMIRLEYYVVVDVASKEFHASAGQMVKHEWRLTHKPKQFDDEYDSRLKFLNWLRQNQIKPSNTIICMEATGVCNEIIAHCLAANGYVVSIQPSLEVKRAFESVGYKTNAMDSSQIAEYAYRFFDELHVWVPREHILEQIKVLLATREQFCM